MKRAIEREVPRPFAYSKRDDMERIIINTEEPREVERIRFRLMTIGETENPDIEFLNRIVERLNSIAKTNEALRTYWDHLERWRCID